MSLKSLVSGGLVLGMVMGLAAVVAPGAQASHLSDPTRCTYSASFSYGKPSFQWTSEGLVLIPRVSFTIRARGGMEAPPLNLSVNYEGSVSYSSEDVAVPAEVPFSGETPVVKNFPCNGTYRGSGIELTQVSLPGLSRSSVGEDQELEGLVRLKASLADEEENHQFSFDLRQFGNLRIHGWRSVR